MKIAARGVRKAYGTENVLSDVSFEVEAGECASIIGPSGAGKTTLLRLIAGIDSPDGGGLEFSPVPSDSAPVILVFQDYILFPHQSIFSNVAFGLRARHLPGAEVRRRVIEYLEYVGLADKADLYPNQLSAGQQQRIAIARAMVVNPGVLLLDEPFANLDRNLKMETAQFIRETARRFGITIISVTHDLEEAFSMSDKIGILLDGRLEQFDTPRNVYFSPATYAAARFLGPVNRIPRALYPLLEWGSDGEASDAPELFARAEGLSLTLSSRGAWRIEEVRFVGILVLYTLASGEHRLRVYSTGDGFELGDRVSCRVLRAFVDVPAVDHPTIQGVAYE